MEEQIQETTTVRKKCEVCGALLPIDCHYRQKYCKSCAYQKHLERERVRSATRREEIKSISGRTKAQKRKTSSSEHKSLAEVCAEAQKHGLSYGDYVARFMR